MSNLLKHILLNTYSKWWTLAKDTRAKDSSTAECLVVAPLQDCKVEVHMSASIVSEILQFESTVSKGQSVKTDPVSPFSEPFIHCKL